MLSLFVTNPTGGLSYFDLSFMRKVPGHGFLPQGFYPLAFLLLVTYSSAFSQNPRLKQEGLDLSLNEINYLHHLRPEINGQNLVLSIKESNFDTSDIDFKGRYIATIQPSQVKMHATIMASVAAGGGNSDPSALGPASDVYITSSGFQSFLPDPDEVFLANFISVQNHSYGTGIENIYGIETRAYDEFCLRLPHVVHVFSAGNEGSEAPQDGLYQGLNGWANLSGQFKQSKNTLTVSAVDSTGHGSLFNSSGPAYDGRIKPEVVLFGVSGTSEAAALMSGISILLQDAYGQIHAGNLPSSALIKAIVVNTARDLDAPGPDFHLGFGSVCTVEAVRNMDENRFIEEDCPANTTRDFQLIIPADVAMLSITLAWTDPAASINASKALVNDLDLQVVHDASQTVYYPWILNASPNVDSLSLSAVHGMDTLNNLERVDIVNPAPGIYTMRVSGDKLMSANQSFALTWNMPMANQFEWTSPTATDPWLPAHDYLLRWKSNKSTPGKIEYRSVADAKWKLISGSTAANSTWAKWRTPIDNGLYQVRWSDPDTIIVSDTLVIADQVLPKVAFVCEDSVLVYWNSIKGTEDYEIFRLGARHLESVAIIQDTFYQLSNLPGEESHFAVAPLFDQHRGLLSTTLDYLEQGVGCYLNQFFLREINNGKALFQVSLGLLNNVAAIYLERVSAYDTLQVAETKPVTQLIDLIESDSLLQGANYYRVIVELTNGQRIPSQVEVVYFAEAAQIVVFPNPVLSGALLTILSGSNETFEVTILDMAGKEIVKTEYLSNPEVIVSAGLVSGMYIIRIDYENGIQVARKLLVY